MTDFAAHSLWLQPGVARYFVATDDVAVHLRSAGVAPERVRVTGVPIDARFKALPPKGEAREALALSKDRDVLLVMAGGLDARTLEALVTQLKAFQWPLTVAIICGRSGELVNAVKGMLEDHDRTYGGLVHFQVLGFVREVPCYMAAADLMVGKPGGLTTSEGPGGGAALRGGAALPASRGGQHQLLARARRGFTHRTAHAFFAQTQRLFRRPRPPRGHAQSGAGTSPNPTPPSGSSARSHRNVVDLETHTFLQKEGVDQPYVPFFPRPFRLDACLCPLAAPRRNRAANLWRGRGVKGRR